MDKDWVVFHLREALEELTGTIAAIKNDPEYGDIMFEIAMAHLYDHLNTAWNSRNCDPQQTSNCSAKDYHAWRAFPPDIPMGPPEAG
jgi:hypothetical protein